RLSNARLAMPWRANRAAPPPPRPRRRGPPPGTNTSAGGGPGPRGRGNGAPQPTAPLGDGPGPSRVHRHAGGPPGALPGLRNCRGDHGAALVGLELDRPEVVREELARPDRHDLDAQVAVGQEQVIGRAIAADEDGTVAGQLVIAAKSVERRRVDRLPPPE